VPLVEGEGEEDKVELANALFGETETKVQGKEEKEQSQQGAKKEGADGDLVGRTVTLSDSTTGIVVAHRHPVAFVLVDSPDATASDTECSISNKLVTLDPSSVPPGSSVDYLGRHVAVLEDGSVGRALPKAADTATAGVSDNAVENVMDAVASVDIGIVDAQITNSVTTDGAVSGDHGRRPIFVAIPKISEIGLIDSPLVTGITAIDALTPIGKGQNMLIVGPEEDASGGIVNKRGWMINLLRNVVENQKKRVSEEDPLDIQPSIGGKGVRCFYGLTSGENKVRASVLGGIEKAGIQDDIVTVVSTHDGGSTEDSKDDDATKKLEAAEAVAVAAAAITLGEHHALTTGGDAVVVIDDVNLHKTLWDITTQELVQVYGVDAVVEADLNGGSSSEMRGFFSGLIQRAARYNAKKGSGSVTLLLLSTLPNPADTETDENAEEDELVFEASDFDAMAEKIKDRISMLVKANVPLTPTNLAKIQIPVPRPSAAENVKRLALQHVEDLISMSDGQVWLDGELAKEGRSPPLDSTRSLTRVGVGADTRTCRADAPALRTVVGSLRFEFQQATDVLNSSNGASSSSSAEGDTAKQVRKRDAFLLAMYQEADGEGRRLSQEVVALLAAAGGHLDGVLARGARAGTPEGKGALEGLLGYVEAEVPDIMASIDETLDLTLEDKEMLERVMR